ncbi:phenylacetic acid degradation operon negative regulatory protein PaaX [Rhodobium gokarnense]|uniref:Phenylacetic acid degradation operon negative regulatory protein n=1 Tax=Rhodobium gokarnense TaxID=364296 RepID=A0ABT3HAM2_9HYPH|nr:phenylacetic acid degradation operon negative regulatory protein PaaX [Rhodobium gokarnense]MCW2307450.1 phenylacetic acid degradation operon negative regulatory protein [Rhodobium gokarnense]
MPDRALVPAETAPPLRPEVEALISAFHARTPIRTWSLIVTIYGDAIVPRGGTLWVGTLITLMQAVGVAPGLVRTAVSRLSADDWLTRHRIGRRSYYALSARGRDAFAAATERIYNAPANTWNGRFRIAVLDDGGDPDRAAARKPLEEAGYGLLAPMVMIAPEGRAGPDLGHSDALVLDAVPVDPDDARRLAARVWPLDRIAGGYERFCGQFADLDAALQEGAEFPPLDALLARILMIHEFRRILLRDPALPAELLPADWPGARARDMSGRIYSALVSASEAWLDAHAASETGPLPAPGPQFHSRFA